MRPTRPGLLIALVLAPAVPARAAGQPVVTTDLLRVRTVTAIDVAADGSRAVYAVRSIAPADPPPGEAAGAGEGAPPRYEYRSHLYLVDLLDRDATPRQLTFGERMDRAPRLSPGGKRIAFLRGPEEDDEKTQVWVIRADGGEARPVTRMPHGAAGGSAQWSPDGDRLLVRSRIPIEELDGVPPWSRERPGRDWKDAELPEGLRPRPDGNRLEIRAWLADNAREQDPAVITRLDFQEEQRLRGSMRVGHLFLVDPDDESMRAVGVTSGFFDHRAPAFMPDGVSIVYAAKKRTDVHPDRVLERDIRRIGIDGTGDRPVWSLDGWALDDPRPHREGDLLAFTGRRLDEPAYRQQRLGIGAASGPEAAGEEPVWLTAELDTSVRHFAWLPGQDSLVFSTARRGGFPLLTVGPGLLEPAVLVERRDDLPVGVHAFAAGGAAVVYTLTSAANPCVLRVRDRRGDRSVHDVNAWVEDRTLARPSEGRIVRPDGRRVQYWLMEPAARRRGERYPLALEIHGGPSAMWGPGERTMWHEFQLLASWGYGVVYANPRGSGGYGYDFQRGNYQDWGEGPAGDVLAVVDQVALEEWVDEDRLVVTGGSYAGYLTAWIVAHDHRFKAAVAQRGVYDLATFFGEGNAWRLVEWSMGGYPFDQRYRTVIERNSPFSYVSRIRTPLLIMHASEDLRTGVSQSEMLYRALKALGRPVEYARYPGAGHDLSRRGDPHQRLDRLNRIVEFFERHIDNPRPAPVAGDEAAPRGRASR